MAESLDDVKRRILTRVNLATLVGEKITLDSRGGKLTACCPFHAEKSPSFHIYDDHYHCFGCKAHGDAIDWVREHEGLSFVESLRFLAKKFGIEAPELDASSGRLQRARQDSQLYEMMAEAQRFFVANLTAEGGHAASEYLLARGFTAESIADFGFGVTPREPFGLVKHLRSKGYREADMITLALATASVKDGRAFDFFRNRIMLPIHDPQGRVVGFGGRTLDDNPAKYLNSKDTPLFAKSQLLFGFDRARKKLRERGRAIVVEGYMDVLMLWQHGFPEAVACLGTAFGEAHLRLLSHATNNATLLFDGDAAGQRANLGAVAVALAVPEVNVRVAVLTDGDDPDSFVSKHGHAALETELAKSVGLLDFAVVEKLKTTHHLAIPDMVKSEFVPWLARVPDKMQQDYLVSRIAALTGIPAPTIGLQLRDAHRAELEKAGVLPRRIDNRRARAGADSEASAPSDVEMPLDAWGFDFLGQLFYATASELGADSRRELAEFAAKDLPLDDAHQQFLEELFEILAQGGTPAADPRFHFSSGGSAAASAQAAAVGERPDDLLSTFDARIVALVERLQKSAAAFSGGPLDRKQRLARIVAAYRAKRIKAQVQDLKAQLARLSALPESAAEVSQILKTIGELSRSGAAAPVPPPPLG